MRVSFVGVQYLHHQGILHLQLSPQCIMVSFRGGPTGTRVQLAHLGSCVQLPPAEPEGTALRGGRGTSLDRDGQEWLTMRVAVQQLHLGEAWDFAAPELRTQLPFAMLSTDIWAVGSIAALLCAFPFTVNRIRIRNSHLH